MSSLIIYMILLLKFNSTAESLTDDNPDIPLDFLNRNDRVLAYTVIKDKPFHINLLSCYAHFAKCDGVDSPEIFFDGTFDGKNNTLINVPKVKDMMSTLWRCVIWQNGSLGIGGEMDRIADKIYNKYILLFNLHVKGARPVKLTINDSDLKFSRTNSLVTAYDAVTYFQYVDGEKINLTCSNPVYKGSSYFDGKHMPTSNGSLTHSNSSYSGYLTWENSNSYLDCIHKSNIALNGYNIEQVEYIYRIVFVLKNTGDINSNMQLQTNSGDEGKDLLLMIWSCSVGVLIFINMVCVGLWYTRKKYANNLQNPYGDLSNQNRRPIETIPNRAENIYGNALYSEVREETDIFHRSQNRQRYGLIDSYSEIHDYFYPSHDGVGSSGNTLTTPPINNLNVNLRRSGSNIRDSGQSSRVSYNNQHRNSGHNINHNSNDGKKYDYIVNFRKNCDSNVALEQPSSYKVNSNSRKNSDNRDDGPTPGCSNISVDTVKKNCNANQEREGQEYSLCKRDVKVERDTSQNAENSALSESESNDALKQYGVRPSIATDTK